MTLAFTFRRVKEEMIVFLSNVNHYVVSLLQDKYWQVLIQYCIENGGYCGCDIPALLPHNSSTNQMQEQEINIEQPANQIEC